MANRLLVDSLIEQVRSKIDENNAEQIDDVRDILPALNRAQDHAASVLARREESPMLTNKSVTTVAGQALYDIPESAFEDRIEKVEVNINNTYQELQRISYRDISNFETQFTVAIPYYYCIIGSQFKILPTPSGVYPLRLWYLLDPAPLARSQGRITLINTANKYVIVDSVGSDVSVEQDSLQSFVNIVDGQTGAIKVTLQVQSIIGNRITFKSSPTQSFIENLSVTNEIPATVEKGDYVTIAPATCISFFRKPFSNFLIQYAVAELQAKLGGESPQEQRLLDILKKDVEGTWSGREQSLRVKHRQTRWTSMRRRITRAF